MTKKRVGKACLLSYFVLTVLLCLMVSCTFGDNGNRGRNILNVGTFFSLQEAYDDGMITVEDLQSIANHQNNGTAPDNTLSVEVVKAIKETAVFSLRNNNPNPYPEAMVDDVTINRYYGTYNNCVVVMINDVYSEYSANLKDVDVAGVIIHYYNGNRIIIWKQN